MLQWWLTQIEAADGQVGGAAYFLLDDILELLGQVFAQLLFTDPAQAQRWLVTAGENGNAQADDLDLEPFVRLDSEEEFGRQTFR